jgi:hypothetical protein
VADVNVSLASVVPELVAAAVKVVVPHPLDVVGDDSDAMLNVGNTNSILSAVPVCSIAAFSSNVYAIADGDHVAGSAIARVLTVSAGATTAVDFGIATALMSATPVELNVAATVRVESSALCAAPVVTPVATVTEHCWYAFSVAVAAASVSVASAVPELALVAVNVVLPHPLSVGSVSNVPKAKLGSFSAMVSVAIRGAFSANMNVTDDDASVTAFSITSWLSWNADVGATTAGDDSDGLIDPVPIFVASCSVTADVRVFRSASCAN